MPYIVYSNGLTIKSPTRGTRNYEDTLRTDTWTKISAHDHTGSGKGLQLGAGAFVDNALTDAKLRLRNNNYLRSLNAAGNADISMLKVNTSNIMEYGVQTQSRLNVTLANNQSVAVTTGITAVTQKGLSLIYNIYIVADSSLSQTGKLDIIYNGTSYGLMHEFTGDAGIQFSIAAGVIKYTSTDVTGFVSSTMNFLSLALGA